MALEYFKTQVLLLHNDQSALDRLSAGFNDRYALHYARTGSEALDALGATSIDVIISAQQLPGMTGLDALREAQKRSPETIGILLTGDQDEDVQAMVSDREVFQVVRGEISPEDLKKLVDSATHKIRLTTIAESANDNAADVDEPGEIIVMETSDSGENIISDGSARLRTLQAGGLAVVPRLSTRDVDILILTRDDNFVATIKESVRGLHNVRHATDIKQAQQLSTDHKIGVLLTDSAIVGSEVADLMRQLRQSTPRLVAIVAGRRDDGEMLMDLINQGQVYRFLLKPVSAGRSRLAIEASVKHHLEAADEAFIAKPTTPAEPAEQPTQSPRQKAPKPSTIMPAIKRSIGSGFGFLAGIAVLVARLMSTIGVELLKMLAVGAAFLKQVGRFVWNKPKMVLVATSVIVTAAGAGWLWSNWESAKPVSEPASVVADKAIEADTSIIAPQIADKSTENIDAARLPAADSEATRPQQNDLLEPARVETPNALISEVADAGSPGDTAVTITPSESRLAVEGNQFDRMLSLANQRLAENNLITPPADNARYYFEQVLSENPTNAMARQGLVTVSSLLIDNANAAIADDRLTQADELLAEARQATPDNKRLAATEQKLSAAWESRFAALDAAKTKPQAVVTASQTATNSKVVELPSVETKDQAVVEAPAQDVDRADQSGVELQLVEYRTQLADLQSRYTDQHPDVIAVRETIGRLEGPAESTEQQSDEPVTAEAATQVNEDENTQQTLAQSSAVGTEEVATQVEEDEVTPQVLAESAPLSTAREEPVSTATAINDPIETPLIPSSDLTRTHFEPPVYPRGAQRRNITGWVELEFVVNTKGVVEEIIVLNAEPGTTFNAAAIKSLGQWVFEPYVMNGSAVKVRSTIRIAFAFK